MKHILFVDDEPHFLDSLRLRLHGKQYKWAMAFVESGGGALAELQRCPYDLVVSDVHMNGMDGARLLRTIADRWPSTIRIALSGPTADVGHAMRLAPVAHQSLSKPCEPNVRENLNDRCFSLQDMLRAPQLRAAVGRMRQVPPLRGTFAKLQTLLGNEAVTVAEVAALVSSDTIIAAKVLQMVNSAFFRGGRRISNIDQAITHLGFGTLRALVMSAEVFAAWPDKSASQTVNLEKLQAHTQHVVAMTQSIVSMATMPSQAARAQLIDDAILAALVHDLGYWVLAHELPQELEAARLRAIQHSISLHEAERDAIGATHAEIGAYLLGIWGFPYSVVEAVAYHHSPRQVQQTSFDALAALAIAHATTPMGDTDAFQGGPLPDEQVDQNYLPTIHAPFEWVDVLHRAEQVATLTKELESPDARPQ
jgi:HD-like signal output (HDOD) protein/ActR/RegA family two-component response regulator